MSRGKALLEAIERAFKGDHHLLAEAYEGLADIGQRDPGLRFEAALLQQNYDRNRYSNILPFDRTRVKLVDVPAGGSDFINANLLQVEGCPYSYIGTQGPLPDTIPHFWQMVWEQRSEVIFMLTNFVERGTIKCDRYLPELNETMQLANGFEVSITSQVQNPEYIDRTIALTKTGSPARNIRHLQYTAWPDHGVPQKAQTVLELIHLIEPIRQKSQAPVVVHCSAGCGRTGAFCTIDTAKYFLEQENPQVSTDGDLIRTIVATFRHQRIGLVQTYPQYKFCYSAILENFRSA